MKSTWIAAASILCGATALTVVTDARAGGYTWTGPVALGIATASNPSNWGTGYALMAHADTQTNDGFIIPLPIHQSGSSSFPTASTTIDEVQIGYYTQSSSSGYEVCLQLTALDVYGQTVYGGSSECNANPESTGATIQCVSGGGGCGDVTLPAGGQAYAYITVKGHATVTSIGWNSTTS